jgi:hypothetical protein
VDEEDEDRRRGERREHDEEEGGAEPLREERLALVGEPRERREQPLERDDEEDPAARIALEPRAEPGARREADAP